MGKKVKIKLKSNLAPKQQNVGDNLNQKTSLRGPQREWNSTMGISYKKKTKRGKNLSCEKIENPQSFGTNYRGTQSNEIQS